MITKPWRDFESTWEPDLETENLSKSQTERNKLNREKERARLLNAGFKQTGWSKSVDCYIKAPEGWSK